MICFILGRNCYELQTIPPSLDSILQVEGAESSFGSELPAQFMSFPDLPASLLPPPPGGWKDVPVTEWGWTNDTALRCWAVMGAQPGFPFFQLSYCGCAQGQGLNKCMVMTERVLARCLSCTVLGHWLYYKTLQMTYKLLLQKKAAEQLMEMNLAFSKCLCRVYFHPKVEPHKYAVTAHACQTFS